MRLTFAGLSLVLVGVPALAASTGDHWTEVRSAHFTVLTNSSEREGRHIAGQLEQMSSVFHALVPAKSAAPNPPITVLALKDRESMMALEPKSYLGKNQLELAGLFVRTPDKNYILLRLDAREAHRFATVYHEYTHYILRRAQGWLPLWLNEGLAQFYQNSDIREKDVVFGEPIDVPYLTQVPLLPLKTLLTVDYTSPYYHEEEKGSVFYIQSWLLTHYLVVNDRDNGTDHIRTYLQLLQQHEDPVLAAQHAFGDLNKLQGALNAYAHQSSFRSYVLRQTFAVDESSFAARSVATSEADAIRADVLIHTGREEEAKALLDGLLRADPKNEPAEEAMGYLNYRAGDIASAKRWYGEAVQMDSHSYLAHYYFAVLSLKAHDEDKDEAIESSLRAAIKLAPEFAPSYDALAMFYGSRHERLDEAHLLSAQAIELDPERLNFRIDAAEILEQDKQFESAINVLKLAGPLAKSQAEADSVQSRIQRFEDYQASFERAHAGGAADPPATAEARSNGPKYPAGDLSGPRREVKGVLRGVKCSSPAVITLSVEQPDKTVTLYSNDLYTIAFTTANFTPDAEMNACTGLEGMKARVRYAEAQDKTSFGEAAIDGQVLSIELSK